MNKFILAALIGACCMFVSVCRAQDMPKMDPPQKEHEWLQQLVGTWDGVCEMQMDPSQPAQKFKAVEVCRPVGGFWTVSEYKSEMMGKPFTGVMTLGYEPSKKKYVGTWCDSMNSYLWVYDGTMSADNKTLTMDSKGPCPMLGGKIMNFRDVMEVKDQDHRLFTGSMQGEDGKWMTLMTISYQRQK